MLEILTWIIGAAVAAVIAKQFINAVEKEIAAHDGSNIKGDDTDDR